MLVHWLFLPLNLPLILPFHAARAPVSQLCWIDSAGYARARSFSSSHEDGAPRLEVCGAARRPAMCLENAAVVSPAAAGAVAGALDSVNAAPSAAMATSTTASAASPCRRLRVMRLPSSAGFTTRAARASTAFPEAFASSVKLASSRSTISRLRLLPERSAADESLTRSSSDIRSKKRYGLVSPGNPGGH